jgi:hypothetical protein
MAFQLPCTQSVSCGWKRKRPTRSGRLDLGNGLRHQFIHCAPYLVFRLIDALCLEVAQDLAQDIMVAGLFHIRGHDLLGVGIGVCACKPELFRRPLPQKLVAPRCGPEALFFVEDELPFKALLALVERGHGKLP